MNIYFYLAFLPLHVFFLIGSFSSWGISLVGVMLFWILLSGYGVGVTLHRLLAHKSFETYPVITKILSLLSCFCIQGSPIFWVAVHRGYHHRCADGAMDLHSPIHGKLNSYFLWACKIKPNTVDYKFATDLLRSKFQIFLSEFYFVIVWSVWIILFLINDTVFFSLIVAQLITLHSEFCVNLFCHLRGIPGSYRNFQTTDNSQNFWLFGLLFWGIGFHNNHHADPKNFNFAVTKYEFDPTIVLIKLLPKCQTKFQQK